MWIAIAIAGFIAVLITVILLLPVKVIIKNDENNELILRYRFLFKTYGENPDPNDPILVMLKKAGGIDRFERKHLQQNIRKSGLRRTLVETYGLLIELLRELVGLLKYCTATKFRVKVRCAGSDAAQIAIRYGQYSAATHSLVNALQSFLKIRKQGYDVDLSCDFSSEEEIFRYDVVLTVRFSHVLAAFWRVAWAEARRTAAEQDNQTK